MNIDEAQLRRQFEETEKANRDLRQRIAEAEKVMEPFLAFAETCSHLPDQEAIVSRPVQKMSGFQLRLLIAADFKALLDWHREGEGK